MSAILNIALAGLARNDRAVQVIAGNVANVNTDGYRAQRYDASSGSVQDRYDAAPSPEVSDVDLATELVDLKRHEHGYSANATVIRVADQMQGTLLDILA